MPKPMYVWTGTAWVSVASEVESLATYATQSYADNTPGTRMIIPTSIAVGSGSGSVSTQGAITFSTASSVSINGCFTSNYQNYRIAFVFTTSAGTEMYIRLRASGTDAATNYEYAGYRITTAGAQTLYGATGALAYSISSATGAGLVNNISTDIFRPQESVVTGFLNNASGYAGGVARYTADATNGVHTTASSYDGFTLYPASGTISGTVRVYGLKNG